MVNVLVFEDDQVSDLYPVTLGRPAYGVTCACLRLYDWLQRIDVPVVSLVRSHLSVIQQLDYPWFADSLSDSRWTVLVSARLVPSRTNFDRLQSLIQATDEMLGDTIRIAQDSEGCVVAAVIPTSEVAGKNRDEICGMMRERASIGPSRLETTFDAICFPHDIVRYNQQYFTENLEFLLSTKQYKEVDDGLFVADTATFSDPVVVDSANGPVVVGHHARVGPYTYFAGPVYIGPQCRVKEHAAIKDCVCLTDTVRVGGEIEASIIEPYTNKQHHGFLGHSYLGSWINLGAGSCNSDLKNTYGEIRMKYGATGMQFLGSIFGDYVKTAINTSIFTGKTIGVCSNLYGFVACDVPSFTNYARSFGQVTIQPIDVMQTTQQRMFARRNVDQRPCDIQLLADMFELTRSERSADLSSLPPTL